MFVYTYVCTRNLTQVFQNNYRLFLGTRRVIIIFQTFVAFADEMEIVYCEHDVRLSQNHHRK